LFSINVFLEVWRDDSIFKKLFVKPGWVVTKSKEQMSKKCKGVRQWQLLHKESYWLVSFFLSFTLPFLVLAFFLLFFALPHFVATITMLKEICKASSPFLVFFW